MLTIGVDIGGTNLRAAAFDDSNERLAVRRLKLDARSPPEVLRAIGELVREVVSDAGALESRVAALGVALAGQVVCGTGEVAVAPNLGWKDVPFASMLEDAFGFPVALENDLAAAAWGEKMSGAGVDSDDIVLLAAGTGLGGGLVQGGRLVRGATGLAAEFGHMKVIPGGEPCGCGELGCLEAYAGGHRMAVRAARMWERAGARVPPVGDPSKPVTMLTVHEAFESGDEIATRVLEEAGDHLGLATANLVTALNPSKLLLGGGVLLGVPYLVERVRDAVGRLASRPALSGVKVEMAALGDDAGLVGVAHLAREPSASPASS